MVPLKHYFFLVRVHILTIIEKLSIFVQYTNKEISPIYIYIYTRPPTLERSGASLGSDTVHYGPGGSHTAQSDQNNLTFNLCSSECSLRWSNVGGNYKRPK